MRRPSSFATLYAWHRASIAGQRPATFEDEIHCGWFRTRMVRGGPWVPARIWIEREIDPVTFELLDDERFCAEVGDERWQPLNAWARVCGNPITKAQWEALHEARRTDPTMLATHVPYRRPTAIRPTATLPKEAIRP